MLAGFAVSAMVCICYIFCTAVFASRTRCCCAFAETKWRARGSQPGAQPADSIQLRSISMSILHAMQKKMGARLLSLCPRSYFNSGPVSLKPLVRRLEPPCRRPRGRGGRVRTSMPVSCDELL